jgi:hypothetical protein
MARQFLAIPAASATAERVFSFTGLTLSDLHKSLVEGTLEVIMWVKWGSPSIQLSVIYGVTVTVLLFLKVIGKLTVFFLQLQEFRFRQQTVDYSTSAVWRSPRSVDRK